MFKIVNLCEVYKSFWGPIEMDSNLTCKFEWVDYLPEYEVKKIQLNTITLMPL